MQPETQTPPQPDQPLSPEQPASIGVSPAPAGVSPAPAGVSPAPPKTNWGLIIGLCAAVVILVVGGMATLILLAASHIASTGGNDIPGSTSTGLESAAATPEFQDMVWAADAAQIQTALAAGWNNVSSGSGEAAYQYKGTTCSAYFTQPDGLKAYGVSAEEVAENSITAFAKTAGEPVSDVLASDMPDVTMDTTGSASIYTLAFTAKRVTFPSKNIEAKVIAYQNGDFGLAAIASCNNKDAGLLDTTVVPFVESWKAKITE